MTEKRKIVKISRQNHSEQSSFRRYSLVFCLAIAFFCLSMYAGVRFFGAQSIFEQSQSTGLPNTELATLASGEVLGQAVAFAQRGVAAQKLKAPRKPYGIAAGGGLTGYSQTALNKYFKSLKSLGVTWVRWDIDWSVIQADNPENFDWDATDRVAATAKKYGINSLGIITYTPKWAAVRSCDSNSKCEPADPEAFGRFAGVVASRYKESIAYWEIWNEPNITPFWKPEPDAEKYADILKAAYIEIKKENPQTVVLSGGLAVAGDEPDGDISSLAFMQTLYESGASQSFDAIAMHPYTYPASPNYEGDGNNWREILPIRQLMDDNGDGAKKIWITEFGAPTSGLGQPYATNQFKKFRFGADYMSKRAQRDILKEATAFYREHTDWMGPFFWYSLQDSSSNRNTTENFFGLLDYKGHKKPAYKVFQKIISSKK